MAEYREVLERPAFAFRAGDIKTLLSRIAANGVPLAPAPLADRLPDAGDRPFLEVAVSATLHSSSPAISSTFLPGGRHRIRVVSPREFLDTAFA